MAFAIAHSEAEWAALAGQPSEPTVVTVGNFDGVHLGHQRILATIHELAREAHCKSAVLTFFPHPARVLRPAEAPPLLMTLDQRLDAIRQLGIDAALVLRFDNQLASVAPEDFVRRFLVDTLHARTVLVGGDFRFGHQQAGDVKMLAQLGQRWNFDVKTQPPVIKDGIVVSSTAIRGALREGRVEDAGGLLGRPYALAGEIRTGTGQGRKLIVPTLNLATEQEMLPKNGVYATEVSVPEKRIAPPPTSASAPLSTAATSPSSPTSSISARISPAEKWKCTSGRACATSRNFPARMPCAAKS